MIGFFVGCSPFSMLRRQLLLPLVFLCVRGIKISLANLSVYLPQFEQSMTITPGKLMLLFAFWSEATDKVCSFPAPSWMTRLKVDEKTFKWNNFQILQDNILQ